MSNLEAAVKSAMLELGAERNISAYELNRLADGIIKILDEATNE